MTYGRRYFGIPSRNLTGYAGMATDWGAPLGCEPVVTKLNCPPVTKEEFRARFPVFTVATGFTDTVVNQALADAGLRADGTWSSCADYSQAVAYLAAHFLVLNALAAAEMPIGDGSGSFIEGGDVTSVQFEAMRVSFSAAKLSGGGSSRIGSEGVYDLTATPYGQRYLDLLQLNKPPVLVV
jgi:hypothetical protein